jgi:tetratricopeptide (TPR) repeat protein
MTRLTNTAALCGALAIACLMAWTASSAGVSATKTKTYGRYNFAFKGPTKLKANVDGDTATLSFDKPVEASPDEIAAALPDYVRYASVSADKKRVTLKLHQPYRIRQFVSGSSVGVDLVGTGTKQQTVAAKKPAPSPKKSSLSSAQVMAATSPSAAGEAEDMLSTKSKDSNPQAAKAEPATTTPATSSEPVLSTKPAAEATAPSPASAKAAEPKAEQAPASDDMLSTKSAPATNQPQQSASKHTTESEKKDTALAPSTPEATAPEKPAAKQSVAAKDDANFLVTAHSENGETTLNFPWKERTATAVFRRARDIWIVFSRTKDMNAKLLLTVMPKHVINVVQYDHKGNTVLKLATDGNIEASASQISGQYGWNVVLGPKSTKPTQDTAMTADALDGTTRLILGIFDVSEPLRFYDPTAGDLMTIIPSFENGRGVSVQRSFPELTILEANQGIAIVSKRSDLKTSQTRSGLILDVDGGLSVSDSLPKLANATPVPSANANSGIMIPYDQWYVPRKAYLETLFSRLETIAASSPASKPDNLFELVKLYLSEGMGAESSGVLDIIRSQYPEYYTANKLAMLHAVAQVLMNHIDTASQYLAAPELANLEEAMLWRQLVAVYAPAPTTAEAVQKSSVVPQPSTFTDASGPDTDTPEATTGPATNAIATRPVFQLLKYNKSFIRYYPPRIRHQLTVMAADAYIRDGQEEKAVAAFDILVRDGIIDPVKPEAEYALASTANKKGEVDKALEIFDRLSNQKENPRVAAKARYAAAKARHASAKLSIDEATDVMENIRMTWRGDETERALLADLVVLYTEGKRYDDVLRSYKAILDGFPADPETLTISGEMSQLFQRIFLDDLADDMEPLKALSLFYEFRELTPLGEQGDQMIQHLADRLAAVDLLGRATQLLEHQVKYRATTEGRAKIGARLALLYLFNKQPQEALNILEVTNYGGSPIELQRQRQQLTAEALTTLGKHEEALGVIYNDPTPTGSLLRLDILWAMQDWTNVVNRAEDILNARPNLTDPLSTKETEVLLKLALAYTFESDYTQLRYLRDYYSNLIPDSAYKQIFEFITNDTTPLDPEDFNMIAQQISRTEGFLGTFKAKIAEGKLSEAIK